MFQITRSVLVDMLEHAHRTAPIECCGLLTGRTSVMDESLPCTNEDCSPTSFSIPPIELLDSFRSLRERDRRLLGIYHSHPTGPEGPSRRDSGEFEYPGVSYWIVSLHRPRPVVRCFRWAGADFEEAAFEAVDGGDASRSERQAPESGGLP
jgi:proteasome lid subunit RPN8/RPN11